MNRNLKKRLFRTHNNRTTKFEKGEIQMLKSVFFFLLIPLTVFGQRTVTYDSLAKKIMIEGLASGKAYSMLAELSNGIGPRLSGSENAEKAVQWAKKTMEMLGFDNVHLEKVEVPHWVRGDIEQAVIVSYASYQNKKMNICALGGSIGTSKNGISAEVIEVQSWDELRSIGERAKGKIIFFNRPMNRALFSTGAAYGGAVDQRGRGASEAAKYGAVAVLVRSMTTRSDDYPHTGSVVYIDSIAKIPAAAISTMAADGLSELLAKEKKVTVRLELNCQILPDVPSSNVIGEWRGSEKPDEIVTIGGHLDSWDKGRGAHDDGAGCMHCVEAVRLLKVLGLQPKRTIRVVLFMNEENGLRGAKAYAQAHLDKEKLTASIESDNGGFSPRGFTVQADSIKTEKILHWTYALRPLEADRLSKGGSGADIGELAKHGIPSLGLRTDSQKYFDYHHSDLDTIDKVNERELELGAVAVAIMAYMLANEDL
jgi:carboxypeptidase Q